MHFLKILVKKVLNYMDSQDYINLAKIRMERSFELLEEAKVLLSMRVK